jgi:hypothetical protein
MVEEAVAMVVVVVGMVEALVVAVAILVALPAMASQLTVGTEVTTGTKSLSTFPEQPANKRIYNSYDRDRLGRHGLKQNMRRFFARPTLRPDPLRGWKKEWSEHL